MQATVYAVAFSFMSDLSIPLEDETQKHLAGGKYDHDQASHGLRGSVSGQRRRAARGQSYNDKTDPNEVQKKAAAWAGSLTEPETQAVHEWGRMGNRIRAAQRGETLPGGPMAAERDQEVLKNWESALAKGVRYEGTIQRGMSNVPAETIQGWIKAGGIRLENDQSGTKSPDIAKKFTGGAHPARVVWIARQRSGVDLFGQTRVTEGGRTVRESEVVMRKGTQYRIAGVRYIKANGQVWNSAKFFSGTNWSWPDNPPPASQFPGPHWASSGHYEFSLIEVGE